MDHQSTLALLWKLRRCAAGMRLIDVYLRTGISMNRISLIEQGRRVPTELEARLIESALPPLPEIVLNRKEERRSAPDAAN